MKYLLLICAISFFAGCVRSKDKKTRPLDTQITIAPIQDVISDSVNTKIHQIIENTQEYQSLKKQYKEKLELLVFKTEKQSTFEVSIGHIIYDRFSTSMMLYVDLNSKNIKVCDFEKGIITLSEYRRIRKI